MVDAHEFILRLEKGYDTDVGEGGSRLSTGQKQLISFARAVLADPRIFVLDEATASIDTETEQVIQYAIEHLMKGRTSFIIAHRLSTIVNADLILVMKKGKIVEQGTHGELMHLNGYYAVCIPHSSMRTWKISCSTAAEVKREEAKSMKLEIGTRCPFHIDEGVMIDYVEDQWLILIKDTLWQPEEIKAFRRNPGRLASAVGYGSVLYSQCR